MKTDWSLTAESLESFLTRLSPDREEAGRRYEELTKKLVRFFAQAGCDVPDELVDKTIERASKKLASGEVERTIDACAYCYGVARNVLKEYRRKPKPEPLPEDVPQPDDERDWDERELECLDGCLNKLGEGDRDLAKRYHTYERGEKISMRRKMADEIGGQNKLRLRIWRITNRLRDCLEACLAQPAGEFAP
jgi:hypothetical protein